MDTVARVLHEGDRVARQESDVVDPGVRAVRLEEERQRARVGRRARLGQLLDRSPTAGGRVLDAGDVRVAGLVEEELLELAVRPEEAILRAFERRRLRV